VLAVRVSPKMALPLMLTVPVKVALSVGNVAGALAGDAKCVGNAV